MAIERKVYTQEMSAYFWHFLAAASSATSLCLCAAVVTQSLPGCSQLCRPIPTTSLSTMEFVSSHPGIYHLDVLGRLAPSLQACPLTPGLESPDRSVADVWLSSPALSLFTDKAIIIIIIIIIFEFLFVIVASVCAMLAALYIFCANVC